MLFCIHEVPKVGDLGALSSAPEKRVINVYNDGSIVVDRRSITLEQLRAELKSATAQYPELGVVVRGDGAGPFQNVASVLTACRQAGIDDMGISVRLDR